MRWLFLSFVALSAAGQSPSADEFRLGLAALQNNQPSEARQHLERASQAQPDNPKVWIALAQACFRSQDTEPANAAARRAEALDADDPVVEHALAIFYSETGDLSAAAKWTQAALRHGDAADETFTFNLGQALLHRGDFAGAQALLDAARQRLPRSAQIELAYGVSAYGERRFRDAIASFLRVIQLDPTVEQPYVFIGRILDQAGDLMPEILARYAAWEKADANAYLPCFLHAKALIASSGDAAESEAELRRSIRLNDNFAESHLQLGIILIQRRAWDEAATQLSRSIALNPLDPVAHFQLARAYDRLGRHEDAEAERAKHERLTKFDTESPVR